jgi:hypothetical protein
MTNLERDALCAVTVALCILTAGFFWSQGLWYFTPLNGALAGYMIVQWANARDTYRRK